VRQIVTADIGGTHARFALATLDDGQVVDLGIPIVVRTGEHESFEAAWQEFGRRSDQVLPRDLAIAFAGPVGDELSKLTNSGWTIRAGKLSRTLALDRLKIVNDFGAVAHAVAALDEQSFQHLCGPDQPLPHEGVITVIGPGTGLGVALLLRRINGSYEVVETEGGHVDFAPLDPLEDQMLAALRLRFGRVSVERLVSGPGLLNIYQALREVDRQPTIQHNDYELWAAAIDGTDDLARIALERFCLCLGAVAGDIALAHGASAVVIGGGIGRRLAGYLPSTNFHARFRSKGRFNERLSRTPVKMISYPEPGLLGAAAAFGADHH
jgi:glucokinase